MGQVRELFDDQDGIGIRTLCLAEDGSRLVMGNSAGFVFVWKRQKEEFLPSHQIEAHLDQYVLKCQLSKDSKLLATCSSDRSCRIWKIEKAEVRKVLAGHAKGVTCLAFRDGVA